MTQKAHLFNGKRVVKHSKKTKKMDVDGAMRIHLQEEIIMDILSRLPVRSLLRFKCVSKFWMTLISEPYFTMKHLHLAKNNQHSQKLLVLNGKFSLYCSSLSSVPLAEDVQKLDWPSSGKPWRCKIYCCYDGLALIGVRNCPDKDFIVFLLWNPSTRESIVLPPPEFPPEGFCAWGLGYDPTSDDYKILKIDCEVCSEILALKSGSWRKIDKHSPVSLSNMDSLAFVHGAFHWLGLSLKKYVVSFSISNEVYREISLPEGMLLVSNMDYNEHGVSVLGGMLSVYSTHAHHGKYTFKLWVMKDYGVKKSWNQLFTIHGNGLYSITPKYRFSDGDVLLRCRHLIGTIFILSWNQLERNGSVFKTSRESSVLWPQSDLERIQNGFVYTESLISPKYLLGSRHFFFFG